MVVSFLKIIYIKLVLKILISNARRNEQFPIKILKNIVITYYSSIYREV